MVLMAWLSGCKRSPLFPPPCWQGCCRRWSCPVARCGWEAHSPSQGGAELSIPQPHTPAINYSYKNQGGQRCPGPALTQPAAKQGAGLVPGAAGGVGVLPFGVVYELWGVAGPNPDPALRTGRKAASDEGGTGGAEPSKIAGWPPQRDPFPQDAPWHGTRHPPTPRSIIPGDSGDIPHPSQPPRGCRPGTVPALAAAQV